MKTQIILDACCNHLGNTNIMDKMIESASELGADFIKFQAFSVDKLSEEWQDQYDYYKQMELSHSHLLHIIEVCEEQKITPMFTVFDIEKFPVLYSLGVRHFKVASPDADKRLLILKLRQHRSVHLYISTGMIDNKRTKKLMKMSEPPEVEVFYCISKYPCRYEDIDFDKMQLLDGFSDHTPTIDASKKAIELGVPYIERHFTLGKHLPGKDHFLSSTPDEIKELILHRDYISKIEKYKGRWYACSY